MTKYVKEVVIIGGTVLAITLVLTQESGLAMAVFTGILGYVGGKAEKINGELAKVIAEKKIKVK